MSYEQPEKSPWVWLVVELLERVGKKGESYKSEITLLATSAAEACAIVGEDERRHIIEVRQLCPISRVPDEIYIPMCVVKKMSGEAIAVSSALSADTKEGA